MTPTFIDPWTWYQQAYVTAMLRGDEKRQRLREVFDIFAGNHDDSDPYLAKVLIDGIRIAREVDEPYWELLFLYWQYRIETNASKPLDATTRLFVLANNKKYKGCPILGFIYHDMVEAYLLYDPLSYVQNIRDAIDYTIANIPMNKLTYANLLLAKVRLLYDLDEFNAIHKPAKTLLKYSEDRANLLAMGYLYIACAFYQEGRDDLALDNITIAKSITETDDDLKTHITVLLWESVFLAATGNFAMAMKRRDEVMAHQRKHQTPLYYISFEADAEYWRHTFGWIGQMRYLDVLNDLIDKTHDLPYCNFDTRVNLIRAEREVHPVVWWLFRLIAGVPKLSQQIEIAEDRASQRFNPDAYRRRLKDIAH
jgi:hypothetical protein